MNEETHINKEIHANEEASSEQKKGKRQKKAKKKKGSSISTIILVVIMLAGVAVFAYPSVSDWWNSLHATQAIAGYVEAVESMTKEEKEAIFAEARKFNEALPNGTHFQLSDEEYAQYESILDVTGTGIMGYVQIKSIGVNLPVYHGVEEGILQIAVGHIPGSSFPVGGERTHAVLSGHRGLPSAKLFSDLDKLGEGDTFTITVLDETITYMVDQIRIVLPEETDELAIVDGEDYCTLTTCTPYGVNSHRILPVHKKRQLQLCSHAVRTGYQRRLLHGFKGFHGKGPGKTSDSRQHLRPHGHCNMLLHQLHGLVSGLNIYSCIFIIHFSNPPL